jgi:hypothetical protein
LFSFCSPLYICFSEIIFIFLSRVLHAQVKQDPYPEESGNYTLRLVGTRDARIDQSASQASVVVVSSDHPYGIVDFVGPNSYNVSEDVGHVTLRVIRNKGHTGRLLVTINVVSSGATEGKDFEISPKGWSNEVVFFISTSSKSC